MIIVGIWCLTILCGRSASTHPMWQTLSISRDTLATLQSAVITALDLRERLELMPWPGKEKVARADSIKRKALSALLTEKLLAAEYDRSGLRYTKEILRLRKGLEQTLLRDALYRIDVVAKTTIPDDLIRDALRWYLEEREVLVFQVRSQSDGILLQKRLQGSAGQAGRLRAYKDDLVVQSSPVVVRYGTMESSVEDVVFLLDSGDVSSPVLSVPDGWLVMALLDRRFNDEAGRMDPIERGRRVEKILRSRREAERAKTLYFDILSAQKAQADPSVFEEFAAALEARWRSDTTAFREGKDFLFTSGMTDLLERDLDPLLEQSLVRTSGGSISLGEILELMRYEQYTVSTLDPLAVRLELNERVKAMSANAILADEARRRGYHQREDVLRDLRIWDDYWKSRRLYDTIRDTIEISDEEQVVYMMAQNDIFGNRFEVNVREMLAGNQDEMRSVLSRLSIGENLSDIARIGTRREEWRSAGGESGYFRVGDHPALGYLALIADIGEFQGPILLEEGYSIFIPLGKRGIDGQEFDVDSFRVELRQRLLHEKQRRMISDYVQDLARQEGVLINEGAVARMRLTGANMFTRRYIGFGGIMTAVPMLTSYWDWLIEVGDDIRYLP